MIIDLTFIHERPNAIAMYWGIAGCYPLIVLALLVPALENWRTFYAVWTIPCLLSVALAFFFYRETYFIRPPVAFDGRILLQSSSERVKVYDTWEDAPEDKELPEEPESRGFRRWLRDFATIRRTKGGWKAMGACYPQILFCFFNPLLFWVVLLNAIAFGGMLVIGETFSTILSFPPYSLPVRMSGLINLAAAGGSLLSWPLSTFTTNWVSRRLTIACGGVRHAEHYLPAFVLPILTGAASNLLYGLTLHNKWPVVWVFVAYGLNAISYASLSTANTLWVTEAFPRWAAPAMVLVGGGSYIESFGMSFAIPPWLEAQGILLANIEIAAAFFFIGFVIVPTAFWGRKMRQIIHGRWALNEEGALRPK